MFRPKVVVTFIVLTVLATLCWIYSLTSPSASQAGVMSESQNCRAIDQALREVSREMGHR